ncbi:hypothetical protein CYLTODRAFT_413752 [Cylindrobasidium torrendii FP15055 ss-10]|uniref:Uncharacterized protein n=1 Tax=Cylindrobasidium torrendii FP15055 ss-10 TaxID=1314674 RepID=A0A0D7AZP1_9AGAR|nr:hypothetical protein CYLTODRAFT_413752 [Cylindrobasidium torrendii FP15055 ss-10]
MTRVLRGLLAGDTTYTANEIRVLYRRDSHCDVYNGQGLNQAFLSGHERQIPPHPLARPPSQRLTDIVRPSACPEIGSAFNVFDATGTAGMNFPRETVRAFYIRYRLDDPRVNLEYGAMDVPRPARLGFQARLLAAVWRAHWIKLYSAQEKELGLPLTLVVTRCEGGNLALTIVRSSKNHMSMHITTDLLVAILAMYADAI